MIAALTSGTPPSALRVLPPPRLARYPPHPLRAPLPLLFHTLFLRYSRVPVGSHSRTREAKSLTRGGVKLDSDASSYWPFFVTKATLFVRKHCLANRCSARPLTRPRPFSPSVSVSRLTFHLALSATKRVLPSAKVFYTPGVRSAP